MQADSYTPHYQGDIDVALNNNYLAVVWQSVQGPIDGSDTLRMVVADTSLADSAEFIITIMPVNDASQIVGLPDSLFRNDTATIVLDMSEYKLDVDSPPSALTWTFEKIILMR